MEVRQSTDLEAYVKMLKSRERDLKRGQELRQQKLLSLAVEINCTPMRPTYPQAGRVRKAQYQSSSGLCQWLT